MANLGKRPKAVLWLESSITALHVQHMALLSKGLEKKGFDVAILTSEDTIKQFEKSGGKLDGDVCARDSEIDFGERARFLPALASQTSYERPQVAKLHDPTLTPYEFIGSTAILNERHETIKCAMAQEQPDAIFTSLWPGGYGPFTKEIQEMVNEAKYHNPECKTYGFCNDIPYLDSAYNHPADKGRLFDSIDRAFVRGDGTMPMQSFVALDRDTQDKMSYMGHFVNALPPKTAMPDSQRKVLVTYGTRESGWTGPAYFEYFKRIMQTVPKTNLRDRTWDLVVGSDCPSVTLMSLKSIAEYTSQESGMDIRVRRAVPDKAFRQDVADAALLVSQYDIFVLDDISTGIPALVTTGNILRNACGAREGAGRLHNLEDIGAPVKYYDQYQLKYPGRTAAAIDEAYESAKRKPFQLPTDAPDKIAQIAMRDYEMLKPRARERPDPVLDKGRATRQGDERSQNKRY